MIRIDFTKFRKVTTKPGEMVGPCPVCGKNKFYINVYSGKYICFRASCGIRGSIQERSGSTIISPTPNCDDLKRSVCSLFTIPKPTSLDLSKFSIPFSKELSWTGYAYMLDRGFNSSDIKKYNLRLGISYYDEELDKVTYRWTKRIIFPYYEGNIPLYAIGRTFVPGRDPKYLNTRLSKSVVLYNNENIKDSVIVCEGLISSIAAERYSGVTAVPLLGTVISDYQAYLVAKAKDIFISLDGGVSPDNIIKKLQCYNRNLYFVDLPEGKDPDELREDYSKFFKSAKKIDPLLSRIRL